MVCLRHGSVFETIVDTGLIYHIAERGVWEEASSLGSYRGDTLDSEGFIHCSTLGQLLGVADKHFRGRRGLVLLVIEPAAVRSEILYEALEGDEEFPHIYGPLDLDAVIQAVAFEPDADGSYRLPPDVSASRRCAPCASSD